MTWIDAAEIGASDIATDVCIVGAGAAGITIAAELDGTSLDVCLVESGGRLPDEETQALYDLDNVGYAVRENFMSRARYFGGSCNLWAGRSMMLGEADLKPRPWVSGSGWPIPYSELATYYPRASQILRLPPIQRFDPASYREGMTGHERRLFETPLLAPTVSLWAKRPMRFGRARGRRLRRSRNVRVILRGNATRIGLNADGTAVEAIELRTLSGARLTLRARVYVLACGGLENPRLLLASRDVLSCGIGNGFDQVGRYFMDHPRAVFGQVALSPESRLSLLEGRPLRDGKVQLGIGISEEVQEREGLLDHYVTLEAQFSQYAEAKYQSFVQLMKVILQKGYAGSRWDFRRPKLGEIPGMIYLLTPKELMPHAVFRAYTALKRGLRPRAQGRSRIVVYFCEQPPNAESRVTLGRGRDELGLNRLVLDWKLGGEVTRSVLRLQELLSERLESMGMGELEPAGPDVAYTDASHHMGTTRMSHDPRSGVVDTDSRVHSISNLFVAGSSVFPSAGHVNPTLTIVALALRLADHLKASVSPPNR